MTDLIPAQRSPLAERIQYAKALAEASLLPSSYRKQPANVLMAMEYGEALGLSPIAAIQGIHVIDGKPTASAQLIGALVRKAGHRLRVTVAGDGLSAKATIIRKDDADFTFESVWTLDRAQAAGLLGKGTWKQYPTNLLKARAITEVARDACPEVLSGVAYTAEELGDESLEPVHGTVVPPADPWTAAAPDTTKHAVMDGEAISGAADPVEDARQRLGTIQGPARRHALGDQLATERQRDALEAKARKHGGYESLDAFLAEAGATILGGRLVTSDELTKAHADVLFAAFKQWETTIEPFTKAVDA